MMSGATLTVFFVLHAHDDLGGAVVAGHDVGGHHEGLVCSPSQTEVQDLWGVDEQVGIGGDINRMTYYCVCECMHVCV